MKKFKLFLLSVAAVLGVTGAFAFTTQGPCDDPLNTRWYLDESDIPQRVDELPNGYDCTEDPVTCTFVIVNNQRLRCETGVIIPQ